MTRSIQLSRNNETGDIRVFGFGLKNSGIRNKLEALRRTFDQKTNLKELNNSSSSNMTSGSRTLGLEGEIKNSEADKSQSSLASKHRIILDSLHASNSNFDPRLKDQKSLDCSSSSSLRSKPLHRSYREELRTKRLSDLLPVERLIKYQDMIVDVQEKDFDILNKR
jgi:hypothetical protein